MNNCTIIIKKGSFDKSYCTQNDWRTRRAAQERKIGAFISQYIYFVKVKEKKLSA
jgi:hypothetical protein